MSGISSSIAIWQLLNMTGVTSLLDGGIYRYNRPINSRKRDVVISTPEQGKVDVNIHVPNLVLPDDQTNPDLVQMKLVTDAVLAVLAGYDFDKIGLPQRDSDGQWFCQIRINYGDIPGVSVSASLWRMSAAADGYGGGTTSWSQVWSGQAIRANDSPNNQMEIATGRYMITPRQDFIIPKSEATPQKHMRIESNGGTYIINGIIPYGENWRISTERRPNAFS